jgi:beta-aspartyl-peptidase (threonine type)
MENSPLFNAGKGAVFTHDGKNEQDATIVDGATGMAGAVAGVKHIANPIDLARLVMEKSSHVLLIGDGAEVFAVTEGMRLVDEKYFHTDRRWNQLQKALAKEREAGEHAVRLSEDDRHGTVGAVALDKSGNLAAATSSGGMTNKKFGRVGDSALVGAGTWADNDTCAVSTTGHGEYFMRGVVAYDVGALMAYKGMSLEEAAAAVIHNRLTLREGTGGLIAIDRQGNFTMPFNTEGMYRGHLLKGGQPVVKIFRD